jgi:dTDP-4-dehydrorhamnose 3,5-epimerase
MWRVPPLRADSVRVTVQAPRVFSGSWPEALRLAEQEGEPLLVPCPHHTDDRGWSLMNLLAGVMGPEGQINFSVQYPGVVKAWHRHDHQTDCWVPVLGHLKVGVHRESDGVSWAAVMGEKRPGVLVIPAPLWHGAATVGPEPAALLYYVTRSYDPTNPDEHRRPWDSVPGFPWVVEQR